jgi:2,4-dienoyl-CoA reductase-like NADH-dependent reductase (Old Yellow Enzyme family)
MSLPESAASPGDAAALFEPTSVGSIALRNRIVHPAVLGNYGRRGLVTANQIEYYRRRAAGGVGLIITEGVSVHPTSAPNPSVVQAFRPAAHAGLQELAAAVHAEDVPILLQLWHVGRQQLWGARGKTWGVSSRPDPLSNTSPHVMDVSEIAELAAAFVAGAQLAGRLGYDGVELHGAHGYLITQLLSPWSNDRRDQYGGNAENRLRFIREVLESIRAACAPGFVVSLKLSGSEFVDGGLRPADTAQIIAALSKAALVDMFDIGQGNFSLSLENHVPSMHYPEAPFAGMTAKFRQVANGVPIMALGRIVDVRMAASLIEQGRADLVGMGRALVSDPDLPVKARTGDIASIRRCISCNVCWGAIHRGAEMYCVHNPQLGQPSRKPRPARAAGRRRIHVIGGGPAGLESAWTAARRGYQVTLWERLPQLGGQLNWLSDAPGLTEYGRIPQYQLAQLSRYGVEVKCSSEVSSAQLASWPARDVIVACGSMPAGVPSGLARLSPWSPDDARWRELPAMRPADALVIDESGSYYAYAPVIRLRQAGWHVTIVSGRTAPAWQLDYLSSIHVSRWIRQQDVEFLGGLTAAKVQGNELVMRDVFTNSEHAMRVPALTVWAGHRTSRPIASDEIASDGRAAGLHVIGDAYAPRDIATAIREGSRAGHEI